MDSEKKSRIVVYVPLSISRDLEKAALRSSISISSLLKVAIARRIKGEYEEPPKRVGFSQQGPSVKVWLSAVSPDLSRNIRVYCKNNGYESMQEFFRSVIYDDIL